MKVTSEILLKIVGGIFHVKMGTKLAEKSCKNFFYYVPEDVH